MDKILCKCGCGILKDKKDKWGRTRLYLKGHYMHSIEGKEKLGQILLGNKRCLGHIHSDKTKELMSKSHIGIIRTEQWIKNQSIANYKYGSKVWHRNIARKIMSKHLGRELNNTEVVHHLDYNYKNNEVNNLYLFSNESEHQKYHLYLRKLIYEMLNTNSKNPLYLGGIFS